MLVSTCAILFSAAGAFALVQVKTERRYVRYDLPVTAWPALPTSVDCQTDGASCVFQFTPNFEIAGNPTIHFRCSLTVGSGLLQIWPEIAGGGDPRITFGAGGSPNYSRNVYESSGLSTSERKTVEVVATSTETVRAGSHIVSVFLADPQVAAAIRWSTMTLCETAVTISSYVYLSTEATVLQDSTTPYLQAIIDQQKLLLSYTTNYQVVASSDLNVLVSTQPAVDLVAAKMKAFVSNEDTLFIFGFICAAFFVKGLASMMRS